jgi:hypothetical protein
MTETTPSTSPEAAIIAQSLSTVGYAMFSLCRTGTLDTVESFSAVVQRGGTFVSAPVVVAGVDDIAVEPDTDDAPSAFGQADVDENMGAVTPVAVPDDTAPAPFVPPVVSSDHVGASSALMALGPDGRPVGVEQPAATPGQPVPAVAAAPSGPAPALPEYQSNNGQSLSVLQDINFLED